MTGLPASSLYYVNFILVAFVDSAASSIVRNPAFDVQIRQILMRHNFYRRIHESAPLTLDEKLCEEALLLAESMAGRDQLWITPGTNVFSEKLDGEPDGGAAFMDSVESWYQEARLYWDEGTRALTSNFTQMVWNSSERLGVGIARSKSGTFYVVCMYDPPGNIDDEYEHNVFKRRGDDDPSDESIRIGLGLEEPHSEEPKADGDEHSEIADTTEYADPIQPETRERTHVRISWWSLFDDVARALAEEIQRLFWPDSDHHSIEKREVHLPSLENVEETVRNELSSLLHQGESLHDSLTREGDNFVEPVAKVNGACCEEESAAADVDQCHTPPAKKCGCQRLSQLEIVSRKVDMVLVFVVFNNIFMIIFGVAVTLGVVVQWCSGAAGGSGRRR